MTEIEQGRLNAQMTKDIAYAGCAGGLLFNWQDEWFKRTWNAVMYYPDDPTERTLNLSSAEQGYGIMTYRTSDIMVDGAISDWAGVAPTTDHISVQYDSASLYLLVTLPKNFDFEKDTFYIPISVLGLGSTKASEKNLTFTKEDGKTAANVDFLLEIHGKENTRVLTDAYNDLYHYQHGVLRKVLGNDQKTHFAKNSGIYNTIQRFVGNEMYLPVTEETIPCKSYEDGLLRYGT